jgi:hypothetical protein
MSTMLEPPNFDPDNVQARMTPRADGLRCAGKTRAGLPCRRFPVSGGIFCTAHMGFQRDGQGAPHGNRNGLRHGFYSPILDENEAADLQELIDAQDLSGEIGLIRTLVRRIARQLKDEDRAYTVKELATMVTLAFTGTRTIAHLIARNNGGASFADILEEALGDMDRLDERDDL